MRESRSRSPIVIEDDDRESGRRFDKRQFDKPRTYTPANSSSRIYVSNIPYEFKWQDLKDIFRSQVGTVQYVEMFNDDSGRPRGSAVVDFENGEMAQKAVNHLNRYEVKGRKLVVREKDDASRSRDFNFMFTQDSDRDKGRRFSRETERNRRPFERQATEPASFGETFGLSISFLENLGINGPIVNKVFVANLDYKVTDIDLQEVFQVAGKVIKVDLIKDQEEKSRGFAVIEFEHPVQAVQAISMLNNQSYHDRKLSVRMDRVADKKREVPNCKLPSGLKGLGMGLGMNGEAITDMTAIGLQTGSAPPAPTSLQPALGNVVSMGLNNMLDMTSSSSLGNNMRPSLSSNMNMMGMGSNRVGMVDPIANMPNVTGMGAMATMNTVAFEASNPLGGMNMPSGMMGMNQNSMPMGMGIGVAANYSQQTQTGAMGSHAVGGGYNAGTNISNVSRDVSSSNYGLRSVVQISNLPMDYTWQSLRDLCRDYGDIRFAEMRTKGIGMVRYASEAEARRASDMLDRQRFDGRFLDAHVL